MAETSATEDIQVRRGGTKIAASLDPSATLNGIEPMLIAGNKWLEGLLAMSSAVLEFSKSRLDRSIEAGKAIARSHSIDEAMDLQADFTRALMKDYVTEASKLADLGTKTMLDSFRAWQQRSEVPQHRAA